MGDLDKVEKILIVVLVCVHASRIFECVLDANCWKYVGRIRGMKKVLEGMILKWHKDGISLNETARLVPQVPKAEIEAIIQQHDKEPRL